MSGGGVVVVVGGVLKPRKSIRQTEKFIYAKLTGLDPTTVMIDERPAAFKHQFDAARGIT